MVVELLLLPRGRRTGMFLGGGAIDAASCGDHCPGEVASATEGGRRRRITAPSGGDGGARRQRKAGTACGSRRRRGRAGELVRGPGGRAGRIRHPSTGRCAGKDRRPSEGRHAGRGRRARRRGGVRTAGWRQRVGRRSDPSRCRGLPRSGCRRRLLARDGCLRR